MKRFDSANCPDSFKEKGMKTATFENSHPTAGLPACAAYDSTELPILACSVRDKALIALEAEKSGGARLSRWF